MWLPRYGLGGVPVNASATVSLAVALCLLTALPTSATTRIPISFRTAVDMAGVVFAGTADSTWCEAETLEISTAVRFRDVVLAKGSQVDGAIVLRLSGGRYGGLTQLSPGEPKFTLGERYVVLSLADLGTWKNSHMPVVGGPQGFFPVKFDSVAGGPCVHDASGHPVVAIVNGDLLTARPSRKDPGTRLSEAEFLKAIRRLAAEK